MLSVAEYRALMGHDAEGKTDAEIARLRDQDREGALMVFALFDERGRRRNLAPCTAHEEEVRNAPVFDGD